MIIVGAGLSGLIAANYFARYDPKVIELQPSLPNNHQALLRFRTDIISKALNIPFKEVEVKKALVHGSNFLDFPNPYACNQYSLKVTGKILDRSVWDLSPVNRYIAPPDFIQQLAKGVNIEYGQNFKIGGEHGPIISTIPMPAMVKKSNWQQYPSFEKRPIWALNATIRGMEIDVYQTIYFSDTEKPYYRASITGDKLTAEFVCDIEIEDIMLPQVAHEILDYFGISEEFSSFQDLTFKKQEYGKIIPVGEDFRKDFMYTMTSEYNIYSLGRFATWRQILLDDLIKDLQIIEFMINSESKRRLYHQNLVAAQTRIPIR